MIRTKLTEMLGIEYPIVQGCMQWISRAPLVAAVSEAGGLGLLSSSTFSSADELQAEIRKIKSMTSKPFAVNLTLMPSLVVPDYAGYIRVCAEEGVKVMETAGRPPKDDMVRAIKDAGMVHGHPHFPVYVDSPLANEATRVFLQTDTSFLDDEACALIRSGINPLYFDDLHTAVTKEDSMALNTDKTPKVILSSSGMCDAGRIRHHLKYNLWRPECTVLFVGYQAVGTLGRKLHDGAESVKIFGDEIAVHAEITVLPGVSGHADKQGLLGWINAMEQKPAHVFVNHGDDDACTAFAACLRDEYGYDADAPYSGSEFDLAAGAYTYVAPPRPIRRDETRQAAAAGKRRESPAYARLQRALGELTALVRRCAGCPNKGLSAFAEELERLTARWRDRLAP